ncbi:MAG: hypothetical protein COU63_04595 [Candidatus Pacebacteria bacterium CG10_big_fil_rev_8_21_14_0_10_36_11]|nr:hypothetical protein [Candidatus Pacearchaeota archaeon]OIP74011.1 MAG: hypothetical protein AUK08_02020 [Candidatus Pacebacteria bacterium CG2_30_36_39]PIR64348.1 MAG: hypothetical protein COU63_04595 [Candidatus Pacebacteria bacterium CG10_big_fil_rev_8_21_14_0_10_36_11]PJC43094.1 MAG: hypothetical protein CO040_00975 [Candidatus Pacebacteria bacterium CG_4_9_14_0_2_um_filter_36_8]
MAAAKYKQYFTQMEEQNKEIFADFFRVHQLFELDGTKYEEEFHKTGQRVVDVIRDWDRRLCSAMGRGAFSQYSQTLSEKFWDEARKTFPLIDRVGVRVKKKVV